MWAGLDACAQAKAACVTELLQELDRIIARKLHA